MSITAPSIRRDLSLVAWQTRYELRGFARNRGRGIFTFLFPLMLLMILGSLNNGQKLPGGHGISYDTYLVPGLLAYSVITTAFVNMAISTAILRDEGVLKRMQGTPLPRWAYIAGRIGSTVVIVAVMTALTLTIGDIAYGVHVRASTLPGMIVALVLGTAAFTTLGIGIVRFIPNADASPAVVNLLLLPLTFISGVWFSTHGIPSWLEHVARVFPIKALADALQYAFNPLTSGAGLRGHDVQTLAIWTVAGVWLMIRFLRRPQGESV